MWCGFSRNLMNMTIADTRIGVGRCELAASQTVAYDETEVEGAETWRITARADAWAYYERRAALSIRFDDLEYGLEPICKRPLWPRVLTWPDHLVACAEAYLVSSDEKPWSDEHERQGMLSIQHGIE